MENQKPKKLINFDSHKSVNSIDESYYANNRETSINENGQTVYTYPFFGMQVTMLNLTEQEIQTRLHEYKSTQRK